MPYKNQEPNIVVGLDIGTAKVACIVARKEYSGNVKVIGFGVTPSTGLKKGVVSNIEETSNSIQKAIDYAEQSSDFKISSVYVGIAGKHIKSHNTKGTAIIDGSEVTENDINRVIENAKATAEYDRDEQVIHILPKEFKIDEQTGIKEPVGMSGSRIRVNVHIVTANTSAIKNLIKCIKNCNLKLEQIVLEPIATSLAILSQDEKELGVCVIDIGGGTSDVIVYHRGAIQFSETIPYAGDQVTNDIAIGLKTPAEKAEQIKKDYGNCLPQLAYGEQIPVVSVGNKPERHVTREILANIIRHRYDEIFELINNLLVKENLKQNIVAGVVLTGGGCIVGGTEELAEEIFGLSPVRIGKPENMFGLVEEIEHPHFSTSVGLVLFGVQNISNNKYVNMDKSDKKFTLLKFVNWVKKNF